MSTPRSRARWVRGVLVGACSAVMTVGAHTAASTELPSGSSLTVTMLACAVAGSLTACVTLDGRRSRLLGVVGALGMAQAFGHLTMVLAPGHHHASAALGLTPSMIAAHVGAAVVLGAAITAVEYLYVVGLSVLGWLRVFATLGLRPRVRKLHRVVKVVVADPVLLGCGLGMRAPPVSRATAA